MSEIKGLLGKASWLLTAFAGLNWGLKALGLDLFSLDFIRTSLGGLELPFYYILGLAGIYSLVAFFTGCGGNCHE